jgi:hypothetical protein
LSPQFKGFLELCRKTLPDRDDDTSFARTGEISSHLRCEGLTGRGLPHADAFHSGLEVCLSFVRRIAMPSDYEMLFHRSFLGLEMAKAIWNEDYAYQNARGGRDRQRRCESDPVYAYHVEQGPHYPAKPPGDTPDKRYSALLCRSDGSLVPLDIITKRGLSGQDFRVAATQWELTNSVLCGPWKFKPIVNAMMEVTGHCANVRDSQLICPAGFSSTTPEECIENDVPLCLWIKEFSTPSREYGEVWDTLNAPKGWESFRGKYGGGIDVLVQPNGEVYGAKGKVFSSNNGTTYSTISPLDFWSPGSGLLRLAIRRLTSRISVAAVRAFKTLLTAPSEELALSASRTLTGMAVSTRGVLPMEHLARRTFVMGEDLAKFRGLMAQAQTEAGFYDLVIHGDSTSFQLLVKTVGGKEIWRNVSVREIADAIKPKLLPGDKIRLLACDVGNTGGPAQELANELNRTVWASSTEVPAVPRGVGAQKAFVPRGGGKFSEFVPSRGAAKLSGTGGKVTTNEVSGEINRVHPRPPGPGR